MRSEKTEALLVKVREAVAEARRGGVTVEACLHDAALAAVDKGAYGVPSPAARRLADRYACTDQDEAACRVCGCTDEAACPGGCHWIPDPTGQGDLCSRCAGAVVRVTVEDLETGETSVRGVPAGNYGFVATEPCTYEVVPLAGGKHRITVYGVQDGT